MELAGVKICNYDEADILLYVNNFQERQGEIVMKVKTDCFAGKFDVPEKPYMIADVRFANGSDNNFVKELLKHNLDNENFYGYSAWNTTANSLGSLICAAKVKFLAQRYCDKEFKKVQITRLLDDWAYQANVRQSLNAPDITGLAAGMEPYEKIVAEKLNTEVNVKYSYPWERLFEVEVEFN